MNGALKSSTGYFLLKPFVKFGLKIFYRRITVTGIENIPATGGFILYANHQNALMDPLLLCCFTQRPLHWLARADVFRNPWVARILHHLHMIPIHRERDNSDLLTESGNTFKLSSRRLAEGCAIAVFPEGGHAHHKIIRPFKRGMARIVCGNGELMDVPFLPVHIDYHSFRAFRSEVHIGVGTPFMPSSVSEKMDNPGITLTKITRHARLELLKIAVHFPNQVIAHEMEEIRPVLALVRNTAGQINSDQEFSAYRKTIENLQVNCTHDVDYRDAFHQALEVAQNKLSSLKSKFVRQSIAQHFNVSSAMGWIGIATHALPAFLCEVITRAFVRDPQFISSIRLVSGLFVFPLFYLMFTFWVVHFSGSWWIALVALLVIVLSGIAALFLIDRRKNAFYNASLLAQINEDPSFQHLFQLLNRPAPKA